MVYYYISKGVITIRFRVNETNFEYGFSYGNEITHLDNGFIAHSSNSPESELCIKIENGNLIVHINNDVGYSSSECVLTVDEQLSWLDVFQQIKENDYCE